MEGKQESQKDDERELRNTESTDKPRNHICVLLLEGDFRVLFTKVTNQTPFCQEEKQQGYKAIGPQVRDSVLFSFLFQVTSTTQVQSCWRSTRV